LNSDVYRCTCVLQLPGLPKLIKICTIEVAWVALQCTLEVKMRATKHPSWVPMKI